MPQKVYGRASRLPYGTSVVRGSRHSYGHKKLPESVIQAGKRIDLVISNIATPEHSLSIKPSRVRALKQFAGKTKADTDHHRRYKPDARPGNLLQGHLSDLFLTHHHVGVTRVVYEVIAWVFAVVWRS